VTRPPTLSTLLLGALLLGGCNPRDLVLQTELSSSVREDITRACCSCLAASRGALGVEEQGCPEAVSRRVSPCLCGGLDATACGDALMAGGLIDLLGSCTQEGGACAGACDGVLAYP
jgi:hypothetical protein